MINDTIFALSSARGKSAIALYRVSGGECLNIISALLSDSHSEIARPEIVRPEPRKFYRSIAKNPVSKEEIDDLMWVYFKAPHSFTGEDALEFYTHGSIAVGKSLCDAVLSCKNVRIAAPGEFTRRAVINGKMDLTSAEGLMDLINSETLLQKRQAFSQMQGIFYEKIDYWRSKILNIMSMIEAFIDFPDEDIPDNILLESEGEIEELRNSLLQILSDKRRGERMRNGIRLAIYGKPNVGKSTLINYLTQREISIVSDISGTTRDVIEAHLDIAGYPVILCDTAGIAENTKDVIELEGIKRAKKTIAEADIKIFMQSAEDASQEFHDDENIIHIINKIDISAREISDKFISVSLKEKIGVERILEKITEICANIAGGESGEVLLTQERHRHAITLASKALDQVNLRGDLVLAAEDLRIASRYLSLLIGNIDSEDVLGQIFASFCIGK